MGKNPIEINAMYHECSHLCRDPQKLLNSCAYLRCEPDAGVSRLMTGATAVVIRDRALNVAGGALDGAPNPISRLSLIFSKARLTYAPSAA
jgi:hypothetical protein